MLQAYKFCAAYKSTANIFSYLWKGPNFIYSFCFAHQELIFLNKCIVHRVGNNATVLISFCQNCRDYSTGLWNLSVFTRFVIYLSGLQDMLCKEALSRNPCCRAQLIGTISSDCASHKSFTFKIVHINILIIYYPVYNTQIRRSEIIF
jgi:hypothetical protein